MEDQYVNRCKNTEDAKAKRSGKTAHSRAHSGSYIGARTAPTIEEDREDSTRRHAQTKCAQRDEHEHG